MLTATYDPSIFNVGNFEEARNVILTVEEDVGTDERWKRETPYIAELASKLKLTRDSVVLDYGCGIGRIAKALIERYGCRVVGVDISPNMRALASHYVQSDRFMTCSVDMLNGLGVKFDAALSVWVLQHCFNPPDDIASIKSLLKDGGRFLVVNEVNRVVPASMGQGLMWVDDGLKIREMLAQHMVLHDEDWLDAAHVAGTLCGRAYFAVYEKPEGHP